MKIDKESALYYHRNPTAGKLSIQPTKPLANQWDLSLAYSPGVAAACEEIVRDPQEVATLTSRSNLVAVVTNGTAVLGLGNIGPLAAKPVMEGKAVLFKKFAGVDVFDIEINCTDPDQLIEIIAGLEPTFGAIQLEDIKAPECFKVEKVLRERLKIPVFHDDQHGTAICVAAAVLNGLQVVNKNINEIKMVVSGAGAAALACVELLIDLGLNPNNLIILDIKGVVYQGRTEEMDEYKARYAADTHARTLSDAIENADVFLGLSAPNVLKTEMVDKMVECPLVFALANPVPEIMPEDVLKVRPNAIIATGRSDYPNQVNNVLCFPFLFRGCLDVGATKINREMEIACVKALAELARNSTSEYAAAEAGEVLTAAYGNSYQASFGPKYIIPKPFDPRLITTIPPAVAKAAMESGVATRPITDFNVYGEKLGRYVSRSGNIMRSIFNLAKENPKRVLFTEGEDIRVLRAVEVLIHEKGALPVLIGREEGIRRRIEEAHLQIRPHKDFELIEPRNFHLRKELALEYHEIMGRRGVRPDEARVIVRTNPTALGALLLRRGYVDAMLTGPLGIFQEHLKHITEMINLRPHVRKMTAMQMLILDKGTYFIADPYVNADPTAEEIADITLVSANAIRLLGLTPKIALISHSNFGSLKTPSAIKMSTALQIVRKKAPDLEIDGEMQADAALLENVRSQLLKNSSLKGEANLLIMPNVDAANITFNTLKALANGISVGPMLLGLEKPVHILSRSVTTRGVINLSTIAAYAAQVLPKTLY
jgi:malate dehydrogenase (oxaloacetate-decarboxylating)(NADP+)